MYQKHFKCQILPHELELKLWTDYSYDERVKILIESHLKLIFKIARGYKNTEIPFEDLVQEGIIGLIKASEKYEPQKDKRFCVYAKMWIQGTIQNYIMTNWSIVKNASAGQKKMFQETPKPNNPQATFVLKKDYSLDEPSADYLSMSSQNSEAFEDAYFEKDNEESLNIILKKVMKVLTPEERKVILSKFYEKRIYDNLKPAQIHKLEVSAMRKMHFYFREHVDLLRQIALLR
ncbi:MAG: sigma-70 family RNA polymerase sigma factor [Alphaproteobacteria bacterium]|nr:MAG: sigma-70 family RNA polymerase sigma factor [Alphaproteobacteria bacterium]